MSRAGNFFGLGLLGHGKGGDLIDLARKFTGLLQLGDFLAHFFARTALARKLIIALWRFVTTGEPLEGVVLRPAP